MIPLAPLFHSLLGGGNQFASGGMLLMAVGAIGASLRRVPGKIQDFLGRLFTLRAVIPDEVGLYPFFLKWLRVKYPQRRMRTIALQTLRNYRSRSDRDCFFGLAPGNHWFWYKGRPLMIHIEKAELDKAVADHNDGKAYRPETLTLRCLGRNKEYLESILREVVHIRDSEVKKGCGLHFQDGSSWTRVDGVLSRPLASVILPAGIQEHLVRDIQSFLDSKAWYAESGIPYHRGYLLHGTPGTGKSSLVEGLAHHFKRDVYLLHLASVTDRDLPGLFSEVEAGSILLLEDVDCVHSTAKRDGKKETESEGSVLGNLTLSGLLNVLDGLQAPSGVLYFLTTNHRDKLDPALIRPGRVDVQVEFGHATAEQAKRLFKVFSLDANDATASAFAETHPNRTMAELQMILMERRNVRLHAQLEAV